MKTISRESIHTDGRSHDCIIVEFKTPFRQIFKITYEAYNAVEKCNTELFDGTKWNHIFSMWDMGYSPNTSAYNIWSNTARSERATELSNKAITLIKSII